jgi:alpha/beta superfamily hydrolase
MPTPCPADELIVEAVRFRAWPYRLEGELAYLESQPAQGAVVIAGPHPLLGGDLRNNVVRGLGDGLAQRGRVTLRFNYRGVGQSEGPASDLAERFAEFWAAAHTSGEDEYADDLAAAIAFLRSVVGEEQPLALIGYSFGCSLLARAAPADAPLALVAPTVGTHDLDALVPLPNSKLVIAPHDDFAADDDRLSRWFERLAGPKRLERPRLDGHFFRGHDAWLVDSVDRFLADQGSDRR